MMWFSGSPWAYGMGGFGWFWMLIGVIGFILFVTGIFYFLGWLFKSRRYEGYNSRGSHDKAFEELKLRYARGEISREEYETMKRDMER